MLLGLYLLSLSRRQDSLLCYPCYKHEHDSTCSEKLKPLLMITPINLFERIFTMDPDICMLYITLLFWSSTRNWAWLPEGVTQSSYQFTASQSGFLEMLLVFFFLSLLLPCLSSRTPRVCFLSYGNTKTLYSPFFKIDRNPLCSQSTPPN